jgi:hypothetical protein
MELMLFYDDFQRPAPLWASGKDPVITDRPGPLFNNLMDRSKGRILP